MHLKLVFVAVFVVYSTEACSCTSNESPTYVTQTVACNPSNQPVVYKPACFNAKQSLYEKYPLLYKVYSKYCKLYCNKLNGVNPCSSTVVNVPTTTTTPTPVYLPAPASEPCSACAAAANQQLTPEILALLGYSAPVSSCPYCSS